MTASMNPDPYQTNSQTRWAIAALIIVAIAATLFLATSGADANAGVSSSAQAPRCWEDQVIARHGRCLFADDPHARFHRATPAGRGYWYDARYPSSLRVTPRVPACYSHQRVTRYLRCVAASLGDFRGHQGSPRGWWYVR